jgi:hypothetical protein
MLQVNNNGHAHFVVATGQTTVNGVDSYTINDPGSSTNTDLSRYNNTYSSMRLYSSQYKAPSGLFIYAHSPVELLITDPNGLRTGYDVGSGTDLQEIPDSGYSAEAIEDDIDPTSGLTTEEVKGFEAVESASGNYTLQIIGTGTGPYTIDIWAYDSNGTFSSQTITGDATPGVGTAYQIGYSSAAGSQVTQIFMNDIYTITASASSGGSISPGTMVLNSGGSQTFAITPNSGYSIADVTVDGVSQGAITNYTFSDVTSPHTITAAFSNVMYNYSGFFPPVSNPPAINVVKACQAIPVKWMITDANGIGVIDPSSFNNLNSYPVSCGTWSGDSSVTITASATGSSGLQNLGNGNWQFNWATSSTYAGTCRILVLTLNDGSSHQANFQFK